MRIDKSTNRFKFGVFGTLLGGLIALIGFWILTPQTDSIVLFVLLRAGVGAVVAAIFGPAIVGLRTKF